MSGSAQDDGSFPRTLVVTQYPFNRQYGAGIALTNYFHGWPAERLAQIHYRDDAVAPDTSVCGARLVLDERDLEPVWPIRVLFRARRWVAARRAGNKVPAVSPEPTGAETHAGSAGVPGSERAAPIAVGGRLRMLDRFLERVGLLQPVRPHLSARIIEFVERVEPQALFTTLGDPAICRLVLALSDRFALPIVVQIADDWISFYDRRHAVNRLIAPGFKRDLVRVLQRAVQRYTICQAMADEYVGRYGLSFDPLISPVDTAEWRVRDPQDQAPADDDRPFTISYIGTIYPETQGRSVLDLAEAVCGLSRAGTSVALRLCTPQPFIDRLSPGFPGNDEGVSWIAYDGRESALAEMRSADLLVIPIVFEEPYFSFARLSMPAKTIAYMASGVPILVYGPEAAPAVGLMRGDDVGFTCTEQGPEALAAALGACRADQAGRISKAAAARAHVAVHGELRTVARGVADALRRAAGTG